MGFLRSLQILSVSDYSPRFIYEKISWWSYKTSSWYKTCVFGSGSRTDLIPNVNEKKTSLGLQGWPYAVWHTRWQKRNYVLRPLSQTNQKCWRRLGVFLKRHGNRHSLLNPTWTSSAQDRRINQEVLSNSRREIWEKDGSARHCV